MPSLAECLELTKPTEGVKQRSGMIGYWTKGSVAAMGGPLVRGYCCNTGQSQRWCELKSEHEGEDGGFCGPLRI